MDPHPFTLAQTRSADGTALGWEQLGQGPGILVIHGGLRAGTHYRELARALADRFTVVLPDRRGRGRSGPVRPGPGLAAELEDLQAIMQATGARYVMGHSAGGLIGLEAALCLPVSRLAVYEPGLSINGSLPLGWVPAYETALARGQLARAMVTMIKGLQLGPRWLPAWVLELGLRRGMASAAGHELAALLPTLGHDIAMSRELPPTAARYAQLAIPTLLLGGARGPGYLKHALDVLAATIPGARRVEIAGADHNGPDQTAPRAVAEALASFFGAPPAAAAHLPGTALQRPGPPSGAAR